MSETPMAPGPDHEAPASEPEQDERMTTIPDDPVSTPPDEPSLDPGAPPPEEEETVDPDLPAVEDSPSAPDAGPDGRAEPPD